MGHFSIPISPTFRAGFYKNKNPSFVTYDILAHFPCFYRVFFLSLWLCCCFILDFIYALKWCGHLNVLEELDYLSGSHVMFVLDVWNALHKRWVGLIIFRVMGYTEANSVLALNTSTVCAPGSALKRWLCSLHSYRPFHPFFRFRLQGGNRNLSPF